MVLDQAAVMILLALQLAAFTWRVRREIDGREPQPFPFVPVPDCVNILAMLAVVHFCLVAPMTATGIRIYPVGVMARASFVAACVLIIAHPLVVASHYRLWAGSRRGNVRPEDRDLPYCTWQEAVVQLVALVAAGAAFVWVLLAAEAPTVILPS